MLQLREDQRIFVDRIREALRKHQSVLACAPTGVGKTVISAHIAAEAVKKGKTVIFTVHRDQLRIQTAKTFDKFGIPYGFIASGIRSKHGDPVQIASIQTLERRLEKIPPPNLLIVDECHLAMAASWKRVIDHFKARGTRVIGNSASPQRLDGRPLGDLFDELVVGPSPGWLMDHGFLSRYIAVGRDPIEELYGEDRAEYDGRKTSKIMRQATLLGDAVEAWRTHAAGKRTVVFCCDVKHSEAVRDQFLSEGIPAAHIDAKTPDAERHRVVEDFADGKVHVLCNVELLTTGFDLSACVGRDVPVEAVVLLRPTKSLALFLQMVGRGLRPKPTPAVVIDHGMNFDRHYFPEDEREWSLQGPGKSAKESVVPMPGRCENCQHLIRRPLPGVCPYCGGMIVVESRKIRMTAAELKVLEEQEKEAMRKSKRKQQGQAQTYQELVSLGRERGMKNPEKWAMHILSARKMKQDEKWPGGLQSWLNVLYAPPEELQKFWARSDLEIANAMRLTAEDVRLVRRRCEIHPNNHA